jgi:hypothetical protein
MQEGQVKRGVVSTKLIVLVLFVVALIVGTIFYNQYRDKQAQRPEVFGKQFVNALVKKDGGTTYSMFTDDARKKMTNEEWNQWVVFTFDKYTGDDPKFIRKEALPDPGNTFGKNGNPMNLYYEFNFGDKTYTSKITFVQSGKTWKVGEVGSLQ